MLLKSPLLGKHITLRSVLEEDADFIVELRTNPELSQFIHETDPSVDRQRQWTRAQQQRADDYYLLIEDHEQRRLGTISVYNIDWESRRFEWGRWLILPGTPFHVAAESALLAYDFAFNRLELEETLFLIKTRNTAVCTYVEKALRSEVVTRDDEDTWFRFRKKGFPGLLARFKGFHNLEGAAE